MQFHERRELAVPPEVAFDLLADLRDQVEWSRMPTERELLTPEPIRLGSRFRAVHRGRNYEATITTYDRPSLLRIEVSGAHLTVHGEFRFTPAGPGSVLDAVVDIEAKGPMRLLLPTVRGTIAAELPKEVESFARFCSERAAV